MPKKKPKLLTVKFDLLRLAEVQAVAELNGARTVSEYIHWLVNKAVARTKRETDTQRFAELVERKTREILERSVQKSGERRKGSEHSGTDKYKTASGHAQNLDNMAMNAAADTEDSSGGRKQSLK